MTYVAGRQGTGYFKKALFEVELGSWGFDGWLLWYPVGAHIPPHTDPVKGKKHWRLNIVLRNADQGGEFHTDGLIKNLPRITLFRPDLARHGVTKVTRGARHVLSLGCARAKRG